jgi:uncharacterized protein
MPVISQINIYPIKAMHGISVNEAQLTIRGLNYDRNWMIMDEDGLFLTQRNLPKLAAITVDLSGGGLILHSPSGDVFSVPFNGSQNKEISVEVWGDLCKAYDEGEELSAWLTKNLGKFKGKNLRLVRFKKEFKREVDPDFLKGEKSHTAFADGFPFLVTSERSLNRLNERLIENGSEPVPMDRFRPNIVLTGIDAFLENRLDELFSADGRYRLGIRKPCKRCKVTTVAQDSGSIAEPGEPLRTLTEMNTVPGLYGAYFGQNATLLSGEKKTIRVGDQVRFILKTEE